jgi:hypothetical protein
VNHFLKEQGYKDVTLSLKAVTVFMSIAQTPTQIRNITRVIGPKFAALAPYEIKDTDIIENFSAPSFMLCLNLLKAYIRNKDSEMISIFIDLWTTGISYEDFLHELDSSLHMIGIIPASISQKIHQILLRGWIYFAQGKTHTLDMMRLFLENQ